MAEQKKKLTPEERKKVEDQIAALQASLEEQEEATPAEQPEADAEVEEQRRRTAELFDRLNITEEDWEVLSAAFAAGTEDRTRRIVREELAAEEEAEGGSGGGSLKDAADNPGGAEPVETPQPDDKPAPSKHWTEKKIFGKREDEGEGPKE